MIVVIGSCQVDSNNSLVQGDLLHGGKRKEATGLSAAGLSLGGIEHFTAGDYYTYWSWW
jgi:hypothetical protein